MKGKKILQKEEDSDDPEVVALRNIFYNAKDTLNGSFSDTYQRDGST